MQSYNRKVGAVIIMHPNHNNYGTSLQGFATIKILEKLGYSFKIIRYSKKRVLKEIIATFPGLIRSGALKILMTQLLKRLDKKIHKEYASNVAIRTQVVNAFKAKYFDSISDYYTRYVDLQKGAYNYDVIFVGSDQVWGPLSLYSRFYNLLFVDKSIPTFSYASSFGVSKVFPWQIKETKKYLDKIDLIGVREKNGKEIVDSISKNKAQVVADPTMLLSLKEWTEYAAESNAVIKEPYILSYVLGSRKDVRDEIMKLGVATGLKILSFRHLDWYEPQDVNFGDIPVFNADPLDFIKLLSNAEYICTDSFHGTIFSIIFHKKFLTFYRQLPNKTTSTHSRIDSLLELFNLKNRLSLNFDAYQQIIQEIDYEDVDDKLIKFRDNSIEFMKNGLKIKSNANSTNK